MPGDPVQISAACSWFGVFAAVWFARELNENDSRRPIKARRRQRRDRVRPVEGRSGEERFAEPVATARRSDPVDDLGAVPIDAPIRLQAVVGSMTDTLLSMPEARELGHRSVRVRVNVEDTLHEASAAQGRLASGTYGICTGCAAPIPLAFLTEKPWARTCPRCAPDL